MEGTPWVEKYRPKRLSEVVLDQDNRTLFTNAIANRRLPNMVFYGPPGTGKTTTAINLVREYQTHSGRASQTQVIHLNASDDRGVDVIRTRIRAFVESRSVFGTGLKFVILDEVDAMTKTAQAMLRLVVQRYDTRARFCLICNFVSRIEESLLSELVLVRFNEAPADATAQLLGRITAAEGIECTAAQRGQLLHTYGSDIRSMINALQTTPYAPLASPTVGAPALAILRDSVAAAHDDGPRVRRALRTAAAGQCSEETAALALLETRMRSVDHMPSTSTLALDIASRESTPDSPYRPMAVALGALYRPP